LNIEYLHRMASTSLQYTFVSGFRVINALARPSNKQPAVSLACDRSGRCCFDQIAQISAAQTPWLHQCWLSSRSPSPCLAAPLPCRCRMEKPLSLLLHWIDPKIMLMLVSVHDSQAEISTGAVIIGWPRCKKQTMGHGASEQHCVHPTILANADHSNGSEPRHVRYHENNPTNDCAVVATKQSCTQRCD
jgi:hypothetical protein